LWYLKKQNPVADISLTECNRVNAAPKRLNTTRFSASQQRKTTAVVAELALSITTGCKLLAKDNLHRTTKAEAALLDTKNLTIQQQFCAKLATAHFEASVKFYGLRRANLCSITAGACYAPALQ